MIIQGFRELTSFQRATQKRRRLGYTDDGALEEVDDAGLDHAHHLRFDFVGNRIFLLMYSLLHI